MSRRGRRRHLKLASAFACSAWDLEQQACSELQEAQLVLDLVLQRHSSCSSFAHISLLQPPALPAQHTSENSLQSILHTHLDPEP